MHLRPNPKLKVPFPSFVALCTTDTVSSIELTCFTIASKDPQWHWTMVDEFNALLHNGTWLLVPVSVSMNVVGWKWVFKIKK